MKSRKMTGLNETNTELLKYGRNTEVIIFIVVEDRETHRITQQAHEKQFNGLKQTFNFAHQIYVNKTLQLKPTDISPEQQSQSLVS